MYTTFKPLGEIRIADLIDGRLATYGITVSVNERGFVFLFDGSNSVRVYGQGDLVHSFTRYCSFMGMYIISSVSALLDVPIVSEHEPSYWGFHSDEDWQAAIKAEEEQSHADLIRFIRGEPNPIRPGSYDHEMARIAAGLVAANPELARSEKRNELEAQIAAAAAAARAAMADEVPF